MRDGLAPLPPCPRHTGTPYSTLDTSSQYATHHTHLPGTLEMRVSQAATRNVTIFNKTICPSISASYSQTTSPANITMTTMITSTATMATTSHADVYSLYPCEAIVIQCTVTLCDGVRFVATTSPKGWYSTHANRCQCQIVITIAS